MSAFQPYFIGPWRASNLLNPQAIFTPIQHSLPTVYSDILRASQHFQQDFILKLDLLANDQASYDNTG